VDDFDDDEGSFLGQHQFVHILGGFGSIAEQDHRPRKLVLGCSCCDIYIVFASISCSGGVLSHRPCLAGRVHLADPSPFWLHRTPGLMALHSRGRLVGQPRRRIP